MKKIFLPFTFFLVPLVSFAAANPFMGDNQSQIMLNIGQGVDSYSLLPLPTRWVPYTMVQVQYSQPTTVFRLPARQNIAITKNFGYGTKYGRGPSEKWPDGLEWDWTEYSTEYAQITWDVALLSGDGWYFAVGMGLAMQGRQNERNNTKFMIPMKLMAGYRFAKNWNVELFSQHYSNGDTGDMNYSYNFWGLGLGYSF